MGRRIPFGADLAEFRLECQVDVANKILIWILLDAFGAFLFMWAFLAGISRIYFAQQSLALSELATQVVHDIRAPLIALGGIESHLHELSEDHRIMVRTALEGIQDIANQLLDRARGLSTTDPKVASHLIWSLVDSSISQKRMQIRAEKFDRPVELIFRPDQSAYFSFARVSPTEFKTIVSNLINNAIEAQTDESKEKNVELSIQVDGNSIQIQVVDHGKGIPSERIQTLGKKRQSFEKRGSGLGLYHARRRVTSWGGTLIFSLRLDWVHQSAWSYQK